MSSPLNVLIYSGPGTCEFSVKQTLRTLKRFLKSSYDVKLVESNVLRNDRIPWEENCALFVLPGGRDLAYLDEFRGSNFISKLRQNVLQGKLKYLGICAGAYFAADRIEFEIGRKDYEISGERPLKLIETCAMGTLKNCTNKFFYSTDPLATSSQINASLQAVTIKFNDYHDSEKIIKMAYNGGCYFPNESKGIFAKYDSDEAAILLTEKFCLSGVHFEYDPIDCLSEDFGSKTVFSELMKYENDRKELIKTILKRLGLNVNDNCDAFDIILDKVNIYTSEGISLEFKDKSINVITSKSKESISNNLKFPTLYSPICTSTQTILLNEPEVLEKLPNYTVYVADHQVNGRGRSGNNWISSPACLQFTLKVEHPLNRSHRLPLIQFLMAISITETINSLKLLGEFKAKIKWPNDIYLTQNNTNLIGKLSGILVNAQQSPRKRINQVLIGVGLNLLSEPVLPNITHLNDYLQSPSDKKSILSEILERFKEIYETFLQSDQFPFEDYYANWLHSRQQISQAEEGENSVPLRISGIDEYGYLLALDCNGNVYKFEPDGNSFDMTKNLIRRK